MVRRRDPGAPRTAGPLAAVVVLVAGLVISAAVSVVLREAQRDRAGNVMDQRHQMALAAVRTEIDRYRGLLDTLAAGFSTRAEPSWEDYDVASAPLADAGLLGAAGVAYVVPVRTGDVAAAQRRWRERGASGLVLRPQGTGDEHYFSIYARQLTEVTGPSMTGVDLVTVAQPAMAMEDARRLHRTTVSDTYVLLRDRTLPAGGQQQSLVLAAPVWTRENESEFRGWVVLGLRSGDFLTGVLATVGQGHLGGSLIVTNSDGSRVTVADRAVPGEKDLTRSSGFEVGDHRWTLVTQADSGRLPGAGSATPRLALVAGAVFSVLLAWLVYALATSRARARDQVEVATAELREAEADSRRQAGLLGAIMTSISDGVSVVDENGRFLVQNPAARRLLGMEVDAHRGPRDWQEQYGVFRPDGKTPMPLEEMPLMMALHGESPDGVEMLVRNPGRPDGVLLSVDGRPLDASAGLRGAVAVFRDITDLRRYEHDLSIFAGVVAHDLKAPLAVIRGHADLVLEDLDMSGIAAGAPEADEIRDGLRRITATVDRMDLLIETLLAYTTSRHAPLRLESVDLTRTAREIAAERAAHPGDRPVPQWSVSPLPPVEADPAMIRHVLDNLIGNAVKYVRPGGTPRVVVSGERTVSGLVRIEVADAGIGIPDAEKPRIFESFHRTEAAAGYAGTGLGLAICRRIVERHGGEIGVEDNPGGGARFHFTLPAAVTELKEEPVVDTDQDDEAVRAALDRALAERAAIMQAGMLPGLGGFEPDTDPRDEAPVGTSLSEQAGLKRPGAAAGS